MRKETFAENEYYHIYNRGVDKRTIFEDANDSARFLQSMFELNTLKPIGSLFWNAYVQKKNPVIKEKLVDIVAYCLNPNHFHFLIRARSDDGIPKFMHRLSTSHTKYFNEKYERTGSLFQGRYKARHIDNNGYLLHVSAYVNLNDRVHSLRSSASKIVRSSWKFFTVEISKNSNPILSGTELVSGQFKNKKDYKEYALNALAIMLERKENEKELADCLIDDSND